MKKIPLHIQILIGLALGLAFGIISVLLHWDSSFTTNFIKPFGTIFVNSLKLIAMPLVLASLITGVANLGDVSKLSRIGGKTIVTYLITTVIATTIGLIVVNVFQPGNILPAEIREALMSQYESTAASSSTVAEKLKNQSPLQPIVDMVPENIFSASSSNTNMLQIVLFSIVIGIALLQIPKSKGEPVIKFFDGLNDAIIKIVEYRVLR